MLNRKLLVALVLAAASSASFAAPATNADSSSAAAISEQPSNQFTEGKGACTAHVEGLARQAAELEACNEYLHHETTWD